LISATCRLNDEKHRTKEIPRLLSNYATSSWNANVSESKKSDCQAMELKQMPHLRPRNHNPVPQIMQKKKRRKKSTAAAELFVHLPNYFLLADRGGGGEGITDCILP